MTADVGSCLPGKEPSASRDSTRRARKRETDRRAQRGHRQRQKAYVRQLEEIVRDLNTQNSRDDRLLALQTEKARLQERCNALTAKLERVRMAVCVDDIPSSEPTKLTTPSPIDLVCEGVNDNHTDVHDAFGLLGDSEPSTQEGGSLASFPDERGQRLDSAGSKLFPFPTGDAGHPDEDHWISTLFNLGEAPKPDTLSDINNTMPVSNIGMGTEGNPLNRLRLVTSDMPAAFSGDGDFGASNEAPFPLVDSREHVDYGRFHLEQHDMSDIVTIHDEEQSNLTLTKSPGEAIPRSMSLSKTPRASCFPRYGPPACHSDKVFLTFIEEAGKEHQACRFDMSRPTLRRLLANLPVDCLSFRLFHYVSEIPAPLQNLLAVFWVQYLFLRWHVLQTSEAYEDVPSFLRPTPLECIVPHQSFIGMLVWPKLREALIRDSTKVDIEAIGLSLMQNLDPNFSRNAAEDTSMPPGSMDVIEMIERQAKSLKFWKVKASFFDEYPQYAGCF
ncbi:uncharacterized protein Z518_01802 [Rhinocladiella mackenziei CBS 650.93]|uniref:BZIP domain-containing protein n=1 Tax=Rhinocladiella mackenziei CBS 650.93 TaxID=1442369 RepID=A0A0D2HJ65_9EURO|nr:uncharacterized protein Z518_01802 [Rhinocladiella mackenziei CBS 650.93]KIX10718.1 hypothetical protein Z518_01802 [Rhinocladiella mackenziei CBS 650.93]